MRAFSITDLKDRTQSIESAARREPVAIYDQGEEFVLMTREAYEALRARESFDDAGPAFVQATPERRAYRVQDLPDDLAEELLQGLERVADRPYRVD